MNKVELQELVGGALQEKFSKSFENVVENLQDINTSFKIKRAITIKLTFVQNELRDDVKVGIDVTEKLAPQTPIETAFSIGKDLKTGELFAEEYGKQIKGQTSLEQNMNESSNKQVIDGDVVDTDTGEVIRSVVDFREKKAN